MQRRVQRPARSLADAQQRRDGLADEPRAHRDQVHEHGAGRVPLGRGLGRPGRQPGLAHAAGADQGDHPAAGQGRQYRGLLPVPADEAGPGRRQPGHQPGHLPGRQPGQQSGHLPVTVRAGCDSRVGAGAIAAGARAARRLGPIAVVSTRPEAAAAVIRRAGQQFQVRGRQLQGLGYQPDRRQSRRLPAPLLNRGDRRRADSASPGKSLLGEARRDPEPAQQFAKGLGHCVNTPLARRESRSRPLTGQPCASRALGEPRCDHDHLVSADRDPSYGLTVSMPNCRIRARSSSGVGGSSRFHSSCSPAK